MILALALLFACPAGTVAHEAPSFEIADGVEHVCVRDGVAEGPFRVTFADGTTAIEGTMAGGRRHGDWKWHYAGGAVRFEATFDDGEPTGPAHGFHPDGKPSVEMTFAGGLPNGRLRRFDETGRLRVEGIVQDGIPEGSWSVWTEDGKRTVGSCHAGKCDGIHVTAGGVTAFNAP